MKTATRRYVLLDTFALSRMATTSAIPFTHWLAQDQRYLVLSSMLLTELFNPKPMGVDRTLAIANALAGRNWVIRDPIDVFRVEESTYPKTNRRLPVRLASDDVLPGLSAGERHGLMRRLFRDELAYPGVSLACWREDHSHASAIWPQDVHRILSAGTAAATLSDARAFIESLDLRLCDQIVQLKASMDAGHPIPPSHRGAAMKLAHVLRFHDTHLMRGIHLSSCVFWMEYVHQRKPPRPSDAADLLYMSFLPYCDLAVLDRAKVDATRQAISRFHVTNEARIMTVSEFSTGELLSSP